MRTVTVVVATYQRRESLLRLLTGLRAQLDEDPGLREGLDVIVVVDGSTDGSLELCESLDFPVQLKPIFQRNRGRAAARNVGLAAANGEIVWFVDDDVELLPGLVRRHRASHDGDDPHVLTGPYMDETDERGIAPNRRWVDLIYREMSASGVVDRADRFSTANASGPVDVFRAVGGFDEGFTGWGFEDTEMGHRMLRAGVEIRFDPHARARHRQDLTVEQFCANGVSAGRNLARTVALHPELLDELLPLEGSVPSRRTARRLAASVYRCVPVRSALAYRMLAGRGHRGRPSRRHGDEQPEPAGALRRDGREHPRGDRRGRSVGRARRTEARDRRGRVSTRPRPQEPRLMSRSGMRRFVAMIPQAFRLVWSTDKRAFLLIIVLQVVNGLAVAGELLVGRRLLETIGSTGSARIDGSIGDILPELVLLAVLAFVIAIGSAVSAARSQILGETVARRVQRQVLNVTIDVSLASFDDPDFHDHVRRSVESSTSRPWLLVNGLIAIVGATAGLVGIMVVLAGAAAADRARRRGLVRAGAAS